MFGFFEKLTDPCRACDYGMLRAEVPEDDPLGPCTGPEVSVVQMHGARLRVLVCGRLALEEERSALGGG